MANPNPAADLPPQASQRLLRRARVLRELYPVLAAVPPPPDARLVGRGLLADEPEQCGRGVHLLLPNGKERLLKEVDDLGLQWRLHPALVSRLLSMVHKLMFTS